jgi:hypothetical protein
MCEIVTVVLSSILLQRSQKSTLAEVPGLNIFLDLRYSRRRRGFLCRSTVLARICLIVEQTRWNACAALCLIARCRSRVAVWTCWLDSAVKALLGFFMLWCQIFSYCQCNVGSLDEWRQATVRCENKRCSYNDGTGRGHKNSERNKSRGRRERMCSYRNRSSKTLFITSLSWRQT